MKNALALLSLLFFTNLYAQKKITGTVTYLYNQYQGNKADVGANICIIDSLLAGSWFDPIDSFCKGYFNYALLSSYQNMQAKSAELMNGSGMWIVSKKTKKKYLEKDSIPAYVLDGAKKANIDTPEKFHHLDSLCHAAVYAFETSPNIYKTKADGVGNYAINVKAAGTYYVLLKSANRDGEGISFVVGKYFIQKVTIKDEDLNDANVSKNFDLY